jgi:tetratricopeptide (TPR) repeat protein
MPTVPRVGAAALVAVAALSIAGAAQALTRSAWDEQEVGSLRADAPRAYALFEQGEALAADGKVAEAEPLFRQATLEGHNVSITWRRYCEALTALGRKQEAVQACQTAVQNDRSPGNYRAWVRAYVDGPTLPSTADVAQALSISAIQRSKGGVGLSPPALACEVATAIGDGVMLQECTTELLASAPQDPVTKEALDLLTSRCPPARFWVGWLGLFAAVLFTLGHRMRAALRGRRAAALVAAAAAAFVLAFPATASAQRAATNRLGDWPIDDDNPEGTIPPLEQRNAHPFEFGYWLQDVTLKGEQASKHGDHAKAAHYYRTLTLAVPDAAIGYTKTCEEFAAADDFEKAFSACAGALLCNDVKVKDYVHFVHVAIAAPYKLNDKQRAALTNVIEHLRLDPSAKDVFYGLECDVGAALGNVAFLKDCAPTLETTAPNDANTIRYEWALAMKENDLDNAQAMVNRAKMLGLPTDDMQRATAADERIQHGRKLWMGGTLAMLIAALVGARVFLRRRSRMRPATPVTAE